MTVRPPEGEIIVVEAPEMKLDAVVAELREIKRRLPPDLDDNEETLARLWNKIPVLNAFTHRFERWLASDRAREVTQRRLDLRLLFRWAKERFEVLHKQRELPRPQPRSQLSPGGEPEDEPTS